MGSKSEMQLYIDREITLRSENRTLKNEISIFRTQLEQLKQEKELLALKLADDSKNPDLEILLKEEIKSLQTELIDYKKQSIEFIEEQKKMLSMFLKDVELIMKENEELKKQLEIIEAEKNLIMNKYTKMMNTKIMKWTGKYWQLLKKIK